MPRTSKDRPSQGQESDISPAQKSDLSSMELDILTSDFTRSLRIPLPAETLHFLDYGGQIVISMRDGSICATYQSRPPTKAEP